jgi:hypothetical protein
MEEKYRKQLNEWKAEGYDVTALEAAWFPESADNPQNASIPSITSSSSERTQSEPATTNSPRNSTAWIGLITLVVVVGIFLIGWIIRPPPVAPPVPPSSKPPALSTVTPPVSAPPTTKPVVGRQ